MTVDDNDFYLDLLFSHTQLRCYVVIELKSGAFRPEYAGKMNFYLSAVDQQVKRPDDNPSIGLVLCSSKDKVTAEYALRDIQKPIGVATYQSTTLLPEPLKDQLPSIEELEEQQQAVRDEDMQLKEPR